MLTSSKLYDKYDNCLVPEMLTSQYGYFITPEGDVLALNKLQVHGEVIADIFGKEADDYVLAKFEADGENKPSERQKNTTYEMWAVHVKNWIRISISPYIYDMNISWGHKVTKKQIEVLELLTIKHGTYDDEQMWTDVGDVYGFEELKVKIKTHPLTQLEN